MSSSLLPVIKSQIKQHENGAICSFYLTNIENLKRVILVEKILDGRIEQLGNLFFLYCSKQKEEIVKKLLFLMEIGSIKEVKIKQVNYHDAKRYPECIFELERAIPLHV